MMAEAGKKHGLLTITEVMTPEYVDVCAEYADILASRYTEHAELRSSA